MKVVPCILLLTGFLVAAVPAAEKDPLDEALDAIREKLADVHAFRGQYTDTLFDLVWEMPQTKSGRLAVKRLKDDNDILLHMEQIEPYKRHLYLAPDGAASYEPDNSIAHVVKFDSAREHSRFRRWMDLLMDPAALHKEYSLSLFDDEEIDGVACRKIRLTPLNEEVDTDYKEMTLWVDPELGLPRKIEGRKRNLPEIRTLEFSKFRINPRIRDKDLRFDPPKNVDVDEVDDITF